MIIDNKFLNNKYLACICNNFENYEDYNIIGNRCYYKDDFIGEIQEELNDGILDIKFKPIKLVSYIKINITIEKPELWK